jgi:hypothetical protein
MLDLQKDQEEKGEHIGSLNSSQKSEERGNATCWAEKKKGYEYVYLHSDCLVRYLGRALDHFVVRFESAESAVG